MRSVVGSAVFVVAIGSATAIAQSRSGTEGIPIPNASSGADAKALIREGIALHDKGEFDGAIRKYRQALELSPDDPLVLYEMGLSQFSKRDLKEARTTAERALAVKDARRDAWVLLGNIYDDLGEPAKAIEIYRAGISKIPDFFMLYFNLGTTYRRLGQLQLARVCLENSVALEPRHASSHLYLGRNYMQEGYRVPAILALTRFLFLEPKTKRSTGAIGWLDEIFRAGVKKDSESHTTIAVNPDAPKDEGDFTGADLMISMAQTSQDLIPKAGGKLQGSPELDRLITVLSVVGELEEKERGKGFATEYYGVVAGELSRRHLIAGYAALALQSLNSPEYEAWTTEHRGEMLDVSKFLATYRWPARSPAIPPLSPTPQTSITPSQPGN